MGFTGICIMNMKEGLKSIKTVKSTNIRNEGK